MSSVHSSQPLKERQRQQREALILAVAEEVLEEKGYYDTSLEEIAVRVGIARTTLYAHFASKEALIVALLTRGMERFLRDINDIFATPLTVRARLEMILQRAFTGIQQKRSWLLSNAFSDADLRRILTQNQDQLHTRWEHIVERVTVLLEAGQTSGELNAALPSKVMLVIFLSFCSPQTFERLVFRDDLSAEDMVKLMGRIFFEGTAARPL